MEYDFNNDGKVNVMDLLTAIKVFKAAKVPEAEAIVYISNIIAVMYPNISID